MKQTKKQSKKRQKKSTKGFTLIELLAVITIMGILMLVAIPAVSRTIENSRRDTFMDTAKSYMNAIKNAVAADELRCGGDLISAGLNGYYVYEFQTKDDHDSAKDLMEQGGKSSWGNADVVGQIYIQKSVVNNSDGSAKATYKYGVVLIDKAGRGIGGTSEDGSSAKVTKVITEDELVRANVATADSSGRKKFYDADVDKLGDSSYVVADDNTAWGESTSVKVGVPTTCTIVG